MSDAFEARPFPKGVLYAVAALLSFTIIMVAIARLTGFMMPQAEIAKEVISRDIRFVDQSDGSTVVSDAATGEVIDTMPPGSEGFVRGVLRSMARQRRASHTELTEPFHLARRENGDLTFEDPKTKIFLALRAFGVTNEEAFARLLPAQPIGTR